MKYRWILFDADDTLFDYSKAEEQALEKAFVAFGLRFEAEHLELYRRINHRIWLLLEGGEVTLSELKVRRFAQLLQAAGLEGDPASFSARYLKGLAEGTQLLDGAQQLVHGLRDRIGMVVVTNGLKDVQRPRLTGAGFDGCFHDVVISEEVGAAKPDREIFDTAFSRMGHPGKEEVLMVGDSLTSDIQGGSDYGIDTCWFNPKAKPPETEATITYEIRQLSEVAGIVGA